MDRVRHNPLTIRRIAADVVVIGLVFYGVAAIDALLRARLTVSVDALPWRQFFYGVGFLPALALLAFLPAALVVGLAGATPRRPFVAGLTLGVVAGALLAELTGDVDPLYVLWGTGLIGGLALSASPRPESPHDRHER